jgi:CrcB protein
VSFPVVIAVGLIGGVGALARFALDYTVSSGFGRDLPYGTMFVNLIGAFALGLIVGLALSADAYRLLGTSLIGAFTTFSTWALESHRLGEDGEPRRGALNFLVSLVLGLAAAWLGRHLGASL